MENEEFLRILKKYNNGEASEQEEILIGAYYKAFDLRPDVLELLNSDERQKLKANIKSGLTQQIESAANKGSLKPGAFSYKLVAAALVFIMLSASIWFYAALNNGYIYPAHYYSRHNLPPGGNKAVLILANGQHIALGNNGKKLLAIQGHYNVVTSGAGQIAYNRASTLKVVPVQDIYNTIIIPRGGQYQLTLADGSRVFLNSGSSLRFPAEFTGSDRSVFLTGEAYFEVAHNKAKPFRVTTGTHTVEVLGTHFNINAYQDEQSITTTLIEGSVKIINTHQSVTISPGQQAQAYGSTGLIRVAEHADTEQAVAWKNGLFQFDNADLPAIMRTLSRWYDVDVKYDGAIPERRFSGKIYRNISIAQAFEIINFSGIRFRMEKESGSQKTTRIIVIP